MVKRIGLLAVVIALGLVVAASAAQGTGKISGTARTAEGQVLPNAKVQLRNVDTGQLVATARAGTDGGFEFTGLAAGNYVVEVVDEAGRIIGISPLAALAAGGVITGLAVAASAAGALAGAVGAAGGLAAFFTSTGGILLLAGIGAGVTAGIVVLTDDASPSR